MSMTTKTIRVDDDILENIELAIKGLNKKAGVNVYDFSNVVRLAFNKFLNSEEIQQAIISVRENAIQNELLAASEKSLSKDWLKPEEDKAWENL